MASARFTPTEQRILNLLSDGLPHSREEIRHCLSDELAPKAAIRPHIASIRRVLRLLGEDIICEINPKICYRHVRLLASANDGNV